MVETSWIQGPQQITGLDHLGVQAPCINIYAQLLPGITNVTDRARYFSFYPWLLIAMDKEGYVYGEDFIDAFRRADALFTLISLRHQEISNDGHHHASAAVGTIVLQRALDAIHKKNSIKLSTYTSRDGGDDRYFKNKLGGLGQYYLGVLRNLHLMTGSSASGVKTIKEIGGLLAKQFSSTLPTEAFMLAVKEDKVTLDTLDVLSDFCLCRLQENTGEKEALVQLFSGEGPYQGRDEITDNESIRRKQSLLYMLEMVNLATKNNLDFNVDTFRGMTYSGAISTRKPLKFDSDLNEVARGWASYQRNELLSIALQGLFAACLRAYELSNVTFNSVDDLSSWFWTKGIGSKSLNRYKSISSFNKLCKKLVKAMPALEDWQTKDHEIQCMFQLRELSKSHSVSENDIKTMVNCSLNILVALVGRDINKTGYGDLYFPKGYFDYYPVNLYSLDTKLGLTSSDWGKMSIANCMTHVLSDWCLNAHLRVGLRKLRLQSQSTFRFMPTDQGLKIVDIPNVANTQPRFHQAQAILKDIGLLIEDSKGRLTPIKNASRLMNTSKSAA